MYVSLWQSFPISVSLFIFLPIYLCVCLPIHLAISLDLQLHVHLYLHPSLFLYLFICRPVYLTDMKQFCETMDATPEPFRLEFRIFTAVGLQSWVNLTLNVLQSIINMYNIMICIWCSCCWYCRRNKVDINNNFVLQWVDPNILLRDAPIQSMLSTAGSNLATLGIVVAQGLPAIWTSWQGGMDNKQNHGRVFCAGWVDLMSVGLFTDDFGGLSRTPCQPWCMECMADEVYCLLMPTLICMLALQRQWPCCLQARMSSIWTSDSLSLPFKHLPSVGEPSSE